MYQYEEIADQVKECAEKQEPCYLIRASDALSNEALHRYIEEYTDMKCDPRVIALLRHLADGFTAWQAKHTEEVEFIDVKYVFRE